jgi:hypothetical protein
MQQEHCDEKSSCKRIIFQTLNLDVSIHSKGKLGILLKKKVNEGYVACNVKHYSPLYGTLEKGDLITHWDNACLGNVSTSDLGQIVEKSQMVGFFRLRVKREMKSDADSSMAVQIIEKVIESDAATREMSSIQKSNPAKTLMKNLKHSNEDSSATKLIESANRKQQTLQTDIGVGEPTTNRGEKMFSSIQEDEKNLKEAVSNNPSVSDRFTGEVEIVQGMEASNIKQRTLGSDVDAEPSNRSVTASVTETSHPSMSTGGTEMTESASKKQRTLESDVDAEPSNRSEAISVTNKEHVQKQAVNTVSSNEYGTETSHPSMSTGGTEMTESASKKQRTLESDVDAEPSNRSEAISVINKEHVQKQAVNTVSSNEYGTETSHPSMSTGGTEMTESASKKQRTLESDVDAEPSNRSEAISVTNKEHAQSITTRTESASKKQRTLESDIVTESSNRSVTAPIIDKEYVQKQAVNTVFSNEYSCEARYPAISTDGIEVTKGIESASTKRALESDVDAEPSNVSETTSAKYKEYMQKEAVNSVSSHEFTGGIRYPLMPTVRTEIIKGAESASKKQRVLESNVVTELSNRNVTASVIINEHLPKQGMKTVISNEYTGETTNASEEIHTKESTILKTDGDDKMYSSKNQFAHAKISPGQKLGIFLKKIKTKPGISVDSIMESSPFYCKLEVGDVITYFNEVDLKNKSIQEVKQLFKSYTGCGLRIGFHRLKKKKLQEGKDPNFKKMSDIFEINHCASSDGLEAPKTSASMAENDALKSSFSVSAIDTKLLTEEQIRSLPCWYAFIVNDERSMVKAEKRNAKLMKGRTTNTNKISAATSPQKSSSRAKKIPIHTGLSKEYEGWTEETHEKHGSNQRYKYWFSPIKKYKFRTKKAIELFLTALKKTSGDEDKAYLLIKHELK